jgi:hypothetical protein
MTAGTFIPVWLGLCGRKGLLPMLAVLAIIAALLGGSASPDNGLPGGPSITTDAQSPAASAAVDNGLPGGPS